MSCTKYVLLNIFETYKIVIINVYLTELLCGLIHQIVIQYIVLITQKILVMLMMVTISPPLPL